MRTPNDLRTTPPGQVKPAISRRLLSKFHLRGLTLAAASIGATVGCGPTKCQQASASFTPCANDHQIVVCQEDQETGSSQDEVATCPPERSSCVSASSSADANGSCQNPQPVACIEQVVATLANGRSDRTQVIDLDGDGFTDVAFEDNSIADELVVRVAMAKGDRTFAPPVTVATVGADWSFEDGDGDGVPDLWLTDDQGTITLAHGHGDGTFDAPRPFVPPGPATFAAKADLDGDGLDDYVVWTATAIQILSSRAGYAVTEELPFFADQLIQSLTTLPLGPPGRWALLLVYQDKSIDVHSIGTGDLGTVVTTLLGPMVATADFDGDGRTDLLLGQVIAFGHGDGTFTSDASRQVYDGMGIVRAADFDGDGHVDLKQIESLGTESSQISTWRGTGDGRFAKAGPVYASRTLDVHDPVKNDPSGKWDLLVTADGTELRILQGDCP
jgi:hypothetical protein